MDIILGTLEECRITKLLKHLNLGEETKYEQIAIGEQLQNNLLPYIQNKIKATCKSDIKRENELGSWDPDIWKMVSWYESKTQQMLVDYRLDDGQSTQWLGLRWQSDSLVPDPASVLTRCVIT